MVRYLLFVIGVISLVIGFIGIFVPLLPTTPFVLLSAALFAKSSKRCHGWLLCNKHTGPIISNWEANKSMPKKAKILALTMITISIGSSVLFVLKNTHLKATLLIMGLVMVFFILRIPTTERFFIKEQGEG